MSQLTDMLFHLDTWLNQMVTLHPLIAYSIFFMIVLSETAFFPLAPFLPGDGLLFGIGVIAASGLIDIWLVIPVLILGGIIGNWIAYRLGEKLGPSIFDRFPKLNRQHYEQAHQFYQIHGNKAFVFSRFLPIVRGLVPFVAGVAHMDKFNFFKFNIIGVVLWVCSITLIAYYLGNIPFIKQNFALFILGAAGLSMGLLLIATIRRFSLSKNNTL